ncbi:TVP38/TMEM64 family protein [Facklamia sp. DSM 111018]|uniref:TVP38/TMEM64 family membrane protein n=1 Tax=Facklamia lactis TaxID=2749967 RepID=A0ABS0LRW5_9LACT|nr:TVP38/TMEM64 family protein [Facklamia lactis]MBG9980268.1 TVP38/TMEM64 family protein [Facklamia lactis]MBG9986071.1 TVP38/TMEM64 family protein [Facklamia lactis]
MIETKKKLWTNLFKGAMIVLLLIATVWITRYFSTDRVREMIENAGSYGRLLYIALWIFLPIGFFPVPFLAFVGGMGYGLVEGSILTFIGAALNLTFMFLMSRYLLRTSVQKYLYNRYPKSKEILSADKGRLNFVLALARLMPVIPYNIENYAFGLTDIPLWDYLWVSLVCILPGTLIYVNVGDKALEPNDSSFYLSIALLAILVIGTTFLGKYLKKPKEEVEEAITDEKEVKE